MSAILKFVPNLKEIRIHLCQKSAASEGIRNFIEKYYVDIKSKNPKFPILVRECSGTEPKIWARYEYGKEVNVNVENLNADDILKKLNSLNQSIEQC